MDFCVSRTTSIAAKKILLICKMLLFLLTIHKKFIKKKTWNCSSCSFHYTKNVRKKVNITTLLNNVFITEKLLFMLIVMSLWPPFNKKFVRINALSPSVYSIILINSKTLEVIWAIVLSLYLSKVHFYLARR